MAAQMQVLVIHGGDLVQDYPGTVGFQQAMVEALEQLSQCGVTPRFVAGNHDVGHKPDPTRPAPPIDAATLAWHHEHVAPSWYGFDHGGCRFLVLNARLLNSGLPDLTKIPTGQFAANEAYFHLLLFAYNLVNWFKRLCLPTALHSMTLGTLRRRLFMIPGHFVGATRMPILRLPAFSDEQEAIRHALKRIDRFRI